MRITHLTPHQDLGEQQPVQVELRVRYVGVPNRRLGLAHSAIVFDVLLEPLLHGVPYPVLTMLAMVGLLAVVALLLYRFAALLLARQQHKAQ